MRLSIGSVVVVLWPG